MTHVLVKLTSVYGVEIWVNTGLIVCMTQASYKDVPCSCLEMVVGTQLEWAPSVHKDKIYVKELPEEVATRSK